jgi:hypothetical protein
MFYFILFLLLSCFSITEFVKCRKINHNFLLIFSWLILILVAGLRYETGGDWQGYTFIFNGNQPSMFIHGKIPIGFGAEEGFLLLCYITKYLGGTIQTLFLIIAIFNITLITVSLKLYIPKYPIFGLLLYYGLLYFQMQMWYTRQSISMSIGLIAIHYIYKKEFKEYFILILIAALFHRSVLILIPCYFAFRLRISNKIIVLILLFGNILILFRIPFLGKILHEVSGLIGGSIYSRILGYTSPDGAFSQMKSFGFGIFLNPSIMIIILILRKGIEKYSYGKYFINMYVFSLIFYYYFYEFSQISGRFRFYFSQSLIVLFPLIIKQFVLQRDKFFIFVITILYVLMIERGIYFERNNSLIFNPYQNYIVYKAFNYKSTYYDRELIWARSIQ